MSPARNPLSPASCSSRKRLERDGDLLGAIEGLTRANRAQPGPRPSSTGWCRSGGGHSSNSTRDIDVRHLASGARASDRARGVVPAVVRSELTAEVLRHHITADGCLLVRGLADPRWSRCSSTGSSARSSVWGGLRRPYAKATGSPWFDPLEVDERGAVGARPDLGDQQRRTADRGLAAHAVPTARDARGGRAARVVHDYLGERPALSANKCTVRRVPVDTNAGWHQDGAFLGPGIRAFNVWLALSPCGRDAPGLDLLPRRLDHIVETGHARFVLRLGGRARSRRSRWRRRRRSCAPSSRPATRSIFDDLFLHRTAVEPTMYDDRYAIETWCFAPSAYPRATCRSSGSRIGDPAGA